MWRVILFFIIPGLAVAAQGEGFGFVAENLMEPVSVLSEFVSTASFIIGLSFIFASIIRYMQYRVNPLAFPISSVVTLFIMGVVLVCLPLSYRLTEGGIPYSYSIKV